MADVPPPAIEAASRGRSARAVAGPLHFGGDTLSAADKPEEQRRAKWGEPSLQERHDREERKLSVRTYIEIHLPARTR